MNIRNVLRTTVICITSIFWLMVLVGALVTYPVNTIAFIVLVLFTMTGLVIARNIVQKFIKTTKLFINNKEL